MKIRRLEIQGFKSFVDRVSFDFTAPVTAIVGPNGCGKSNVVDAIRWAMGEQSAKNLRGRQMEDVIFAGSETRKPLGMAEVTITFSTEDGRAPTRYLAFPEIEVTRRLYRDGESEYLINRTPCRLMDITELFLDTGVGTKAYSIIEQGRIGTILLSRPEDRRFLIEEAAGVMKYKTRKQIALRKVETTRRNLERLQDILSEIRRRASSLQSQARKAERFRELREELRGVDLAIIASDLSSRLAEQEKTLRLERERQEAIASLDARRQELENRLQVERVDLLKREEELRDAQNRLFSLKERSIEAGGELQLLRDRLRHAEETIASTSREAFDLSRKVASTQGELELLSRESALLDGEESDDGAVDTLQERITGLEADEKRFAGEVEGLRRLLFAAEGDRARGRSQAATASRRREVVEERLTRHAREQAQMEASRAELTMRIEALREETGRIKSGLEERRAVRDGLKGERTRLSAEEKSLSAQLERIRTDVARAEARLQSLTEMANRYPGVGEGVRTLLSRDPERRLFRGTLAEYVDVPEELDRAVAASLSDRLSVVIGSGPESVHEAHRLMAAGGGQVLILSAPPAPPPSPDGSLDRLVDHLSVDPGHAPLITPFLADVVLVETLEEARKKREISPSSTFVARDGTLVRPDGVVGVGVPGGEETELIRIRREIRDARSVHEERAGELERVRTGHRATLDRLREVEERLAQLEKEIHGEELRLLTAEKDLQRLVGDSSHVARRLEVLVLESAQLVEERDAVEREIREGERLAEDASFRAAEISTRLTAAESALAEVRETLDTLRRESTALKVKIATERERRASLCRRLDSLRRELSSMEERKGRLERERQEAVASKEGLESALDEKRRLIALLTAEVEDAEERVRRAMEEHDALQGTLRQREDEISTLRRSISQEQGALESLRTRAAGIAGELARIDAMLAERHRLSTAELLRMVARGEVNTTPDRARYDELSQRISQMGEVNLTAIDEYRETMARHDFLSTQKKDLEDSLVSLEQAIRKINRTTRKRFLETFTLINDKFREVFPRLFCGGSAELRLTDEENLLETGIDIVVQPPGKRLQNVSLLSGGEKALTAVALIFAIFLVKPTPFCLLDEVDAPLDDANIGRFNEMIREMSQISQFILITHSKTTMTVADTLYGVTMEEPGVSKLVSVKLT